MTEVFVEQPLASPGSANNPSYRMSGTQEQCSSFVSYLKLVGSPYYCYYPHTLRDSVFPACSIYTFTSSKD